MRRAAADDKSKTELLTGTRIRPAGNQALTIGKTLGAAARAVAVDKDGNIWVTTNTWGATSVFKRGADGAPFEESVISDKGALKKFKADGNLIGAISLLDAPTDLVLGEARQLGERVDHCVERVRHDDAERFRGVLLDAVEHDDEQHQEADDGEALVVSDGDVVVDGDAGQPGRA